MNVQRCVLQSAICLILISAISAAEPTSLAPPEAGKVRIIRDTFGVPHVIAADDRSLFFGAAYAQAEDQLENICMNYFRATGRTAERVGPPGLRMDHVVRMFRLRASAKEKYNEIDPEIRTHFEAFAAGVNAYIKDHRDAIPEWIEPVSVHDVVAFSMYIDLMFSVNHCMDDLKKAGIRVSALDHLPLLEYVHHPAFGSNQFAISPKKSATGSAMLSMDPHLKHSGFYRWYEIHLTSPNINVMGAMFYGIPYVGMGRTARTAWSMTVNQPDLGDIFVFDIDPDDPSRYRDIDGWKKFRRYEETYRVLKEGKLIETKRPVAQTSVGPVLKIQDGKAYVAAVPQAVSPKSVRQLYDMARAQTLVEFKKALGQLGLVMFNIVYADADGNIFYISNGRVPKRDERISSHAVRPGNKSWARWQGYHSTADLPQVENPPAGYLMNCNSGPQNVTPEVAPKPDDYPHYLMSQQANSRSRRLFALLDPDKSISFQELHDYAADTRIEAADRFVPVILQAVQNSAAKAKPKERKTLIAAAKVLNEWDRRCDLASKGGVLFHYIVKDKNFRRAVRSRFYDQPAIAAVVLEQASAVKERFGKLDIEWSAFSRIRRGKIDLGCAGSGDTSPGPGRGGSALRPTYGRYENGQRYTTGGSSYHMLIDFSGKTHSRSCLPFGESEHPDSSHFADQLRLYVKREYKPAWFNPQEITANIESDKTLNVPTW